MKSRSWVLLVAVVGLMGMSSLAMAAEEKAEIPTDVTMATYRTVGLGFSAAFVTSLSILGAGMAVGRVGSAAIGAVAEKPELVARCVLFVALAEGLAVLGFAIAMLLIQKM